MELQARRWDGRQIAWLVAALVVVAAAYAPALTGGFVWDDYALILEERLVTAPGHLSEYFSKYLWSGPLQSSRGFYRPLVTLSYAADHHLWRGSAFGFHLTNLLLHLICTGLVFGLCRKAIAGESDRHPAVPGLLAMAFGLAPRLSESVAWISGRTDLAAAVGAFSALLVYRPGPGRWGRKAAAGAFLLLGLFCKEVAIAAVVGILAVELRHRPRGAGGWRVFLARTAPVLAAVAIYGALRLHAHLSEEAARTVTAEEPKVYAYVAAAFLEAIARYTLMVVDPFQPRLQHGTTGHPNLFLVGMGIVLLGGLAWWAVRRARRGGLTALNDDQLAAAITGASALGLVVHLIPLAVNVVAADRFLYFPLAALVVVAAPPVERLWSRRSRVLGIAALAFLGACTIATTLRALDWANEMRLWREALRTSPPHNPIARIGISRALMERKRWKEALDHLVQVPEIEPHYSGAPLLVGNIAVCLDKLGQHDRAVALLSDTVRRSPERLRLRYNLVMAQARWLHFEAARHEASEIQRRFPGDTHVPELLRAIDEAEREVSSLPPERPGEPIDLQVKRASLYSTLVAPAEAGPRWARVALSREASPAIREKAAGYLASHADVGLAARTIEELGRQGLPGVDVALLRGVLAERLDDGDGPAL